MARTSYIMAGTFLAAAFLLPTAMSHADGLQQQSFAVWKGEDLCAKAAFKQSPDYTPEGNRARERAYRQCLDRGNLPPRNDASAPSAQPSPASNAAQK